MWPNAGDGPSGSHMFAHATRRCSGRDPRWTLPTPSHPGHPRRRWSAAHGQLPEQSQSPDCLPGPAGWCGCWSWASAGRHATRSSCLNRALWPGFITMPTSPHPKRRTRPAWLRGDDPDGGPAALPLPPPPAPWWSGRACGWPSWPAGRERGRRAAVVGPRQARTAEEPRDRRIKPPQFEGVGLSLPPPCGATSAQG